MKIIPAIDLREGKCVQLRGGSYDDELVRLDDPVSVAKSWKNKGYKMLHVVDLDAATNRGSNREIIEELIDVFPENIQIGGGIREVDDISWLIDKGASAAMVGTKAVLDPKWRNLIANKFPGKIIYCADVIADERIVVSGWKQDSGITLVKALDDISSLDLFGVLITSIVQEGTMGGVDSALFEEATSYSSLPIIAAGGIASYKDIEILKNAGVSSAVVGTAMYLNDFSIKDDN